MHSWACPCWGPTPGAGWMPPRCPGGSGNSPDCYLYYFQQVLLKDFRSKKHSWACPCRVLPLGQGGCPPDVRVGLEILQITTYIISSKFCSKNFALKCIPGLALVGVLPLGQG